MKLEQYNSFKQRGIINGCGGKGGLNFDKLMTDIIPLFPKYNQEKMSELTYDIQLQLCGPHDVDFYNGGGIIEYIKANYKFAKGFYKFTSWTTRTKRLLCSSSIFIGLMVGGINYFNWTKTPKNEKY